MSALNRPTFKRGDKVRQKLSLAGVVSYDEKTVLKASKKAVWLDNGPGNDPSGPFDPITGRHLDPYLGSMWIERLEA